MRSGVVLFQSLHDGSHDWSKVGRLTIRLHVVLESVTRTSLEAVGNGDLAVNLIEVEDQTGRAIIVVADAVVCRKL